MFAVYYCQFCLHLYFTR